MKKSYLLAGCTALAAVLATGCGHVDFAAPGDPDRVLTGTVTFSHPNPLPDDAEVLVRVIDLHPPAAGMGTHPGSNMPLLNQPVTAVSAAATGPQELGEQTIRHPGSSPVAYRVEYHADDETMRRSLSIEVRISYGGRMQLFNSNQYSVSLSDVADPHPIEADPAR